MKALILVLTFGHVLYDDSVSAGMILDWQQYRELVDVKQDNVFSKSRNLQVKPHFFFHILDCTIP